jgi:hypothetical protein
MVGEMVRKATAVNCAELPEIKKAQTPKSAV